VPRPAKYDDTDLLDRSYDLLWRDGCDAVSIRDLEAALDLKAPSIYRRFHSRDELIARSVDRYVDRVVAGRIRRHLAGADDPVSGLRSFFLSALEPAPGETVPRGCLLTVTAGQAASSDAGVRSAVDAGLAAVESAMRGQVARARQLGRTGPGADVGALTTALLLAFEGLLVLARSGRPGLDAAVEQLLGVCFPGHPPLPSTADPSRPDHREDPDHE
jgi:AcrR family transcriptional regulator